MLWPVGADEPKLVCVVEIPKGGRNKYEYDPQLGGIKFDRLLVSAATYPTDYGYLRDTLGKDGDPLDALVCLHVPTFPGCLIPVKPVGMFSMRDEKGGDDKIICVPLHDPYWNSYEELEDLPMLLASGDRAVLLDLQGSGRQDRDDRRLAFSCGREAGDRGVAGSAYASTEPRAHGLSAVQPRGCAPELGCAPTRPRQRVRPPRRTRPSDGSRLSAANRSATRTTSRPSVSELASRWRRP